MRVQSADFERSFPRVVDCPEDDMPEIAFIGRSNVGKSSLLNLPTRQKKLARVSQTPGCTQLINFFKVNGTCRFVDLPGYGFAKVPKGGRAFFQQLVADYILERQNLRCLFVLIDSRRMPTRRPRKSRRVFLTVGAASTRVPSPSLFTGRQFSPLRRSSGTVRLGSSNLKGLRLRPRPWLRRSPKRR